MEPTGDIMAEEQQLLNIANNLRISTLHAVSTTKTGHPASCSSIAEIMAVLFFKVMKYKPSEPRDPASDRLVLSKGHVAPILYAAWAENGFLTKDKLKNLATLHSDLEGHPTPKLQFIDVATGSLGQGLSMAVGMAYVGKYIDQAFYRVYCIVGDGESTEGPIWEALNFAGCYKLDNLCIIVSVNRLGQVGSTGSVQDLDSHRKRFESFECNATIVDGHSIKELLCAFDEAANFKDKPTVIIAKTVKGKNFSKERDLESFHGPVFWDNLEHYTLHLESLVKGAKPVSLKPLPPEETIQSENLELVQLSTAPGYSTDTKVATTVACVNSLIKIAQSHPKVIVFDTDVSYLTLSEKVKEYDEARFVQCFLSEQFAVGAAIGAACRNRTIPFVSVFGAFLTKAFDAIRMGAISNANINIWGSHCGVTAGEGGPSHMALEDIAMIRSIPNSTIFYPSDAVSCERAVELAANKKGITYIRTSTYPTPVIYNNDKVFRIGEAQVLKRHADDKALIICGGVLVSEALSAGKKLSSEGIHVRIMDIFTVKPIDAESIIKNAHQVGGRIVTIDDHYEQGGLGEAVLSAVAQEGNITVKVVAVPRIPKSGRAAELLDYFGISTYNIVTIIHEMFSLKVK